MQDNGGEYTFHWNLLDNGFFGQSNNLLFRITAYASAGSSGNAHATPLYQQRPYVTTTSAPIRVRGMQVRVFQESATPGNAAANALIYRMPAGETTGAESLAWYTNNLGYLQGKRTIAEGDQLIALAPIQQTDDYTLYHTNAAPTATGVDIASSDKPGERTLIVSADTPLILFNLDISLEWDARADTAFLAQLRFDLQRASELLYDATNGQAALGNLTLYHDKQQWKTAALQIHASNALIPNADVGGIVPREITRVVTLNPYALAGSLPYTLTYLPGAVRMGTVWGRYGEAGAVLGDDWPRALVHELGHYLFYLYDNYVGLDDTGALIPVSTCGDSMMSNAYEYNEFRDATAWGAECGVTLSARRNGRSDWETIAAFYPALATDVWVGPFVLPLKVTQISEVASEGNSPLSMFIVSLTDAYGASLQPGPHAQAMLYQGDRVIDLGRPEINKVAARGARAGDRLCVYELDAQPPRWGCETLAAGDTTLALVPRADWRPEIRVTPWMYAPALAGSITWVNDLHAMQFGQGYWISATQPITWLLKGATGATARQSPTLITPPATYYGRVVAGPDFTPTAGMPVVASVAGRPCAQTTTRLVGSLLVYTLNVGYTEATGACGAPGQVVAFTVNGQTMTAAPIWQNDIYQNVVLTTGAGLEYHYLPLVMKQP